MANLISTEGRNRNSSIQNTPQTITDAWVVAKKQTHTICSYNATLETKIPSGVCTVINIEVSNIAAGILTLDVGVFLDASCNISAFGSEMTGTIMAGKTSGTVGTVSILVGVPFPAFGDDASVYVLCKSGTAAGTCTIEKSEIQWKM